MSQGLALLCSPRARGVSDTLATAFVAGAEAGGVSLRLAPLRDYNLAPCTACGACQKPPHQCVLATGQDGAESLFALLAAADFLLLAAPIHFYGLPAHAKAFVDRSQRFWATARNVRPPCRPAVAILVAGRPRGLRLFDGAKLTLSYFCRLHGFQLAEPRCLRGLDSPKDLAVRPEVTEAMYDWGRHWGQTWAERPPNFPA